jgi:colanic acid biosynthesis glycosyl transferase WcaI
MRLLVVTQYFWPENFRINDLVDALRARGHEVVVVTGLPNYPAGRFYPGYGLRTWHRYRESYRGARVLRFPILARGRGSAIRLFANYVSFALSASMLAPLCCRGPFDAIFVHEPSPITVALPALVLKWTKKAPLLLWVLDLWPESVAAASNVRSPFLLRWIDRLVRFIYRRCDRVLVQSRSFMEYVQLQGVTDAQLGYFPSWAEAVFCESTRRANAALPRMPGGFRIVFTGNIGYAQDFPSVLSAAERLKTHPDIHWIVLGDGRMANSVRKEVAERGLTGQFHLLGSHPLETMPQFLAQADAALVSLRGEPIFARTIPAKIQSYLACARPILAMLDGEGARVIEEAGAGLVGPAGNPDRLAANVLELYRMSARERSRLGRAGRDYYDREFAREAMVSRLESWLAELAPR